MRTGIIVEGKSDAAVITNILKEILLRIGKVYGVVNDFKI